MKSFETKWQSPSNIALVKYWGKRDTQIPQNPSISFTLKNSYTNLSIKAVEQTRSIDETIELDFYFEGKTSEKFKVKIQNFLNKYKNDFPWLTQYKLEIHSSNTFPHSSGIASSASSMSALCMGLVDLDVQITDKKISLEELLNKASYYSRLASGSASRSVYPFMATWGKINNLDHTSNEYASEFSKVNTNEMFHEFCDSIIIVDAGEKSVSSRAGHSLMDTHPFNERRYELAQENISNLIIAMRDGDMNKFIEIVEEEALMLHALMMTSRPSYILLKPDSLMIIDEIRKFRQQTNLPVCFTIDAGPNIHVLYPKNIKGQIENELFNKFSHLKIINDEVGMGPQKLKD